MAVCAPHGPSEALGSLSETSALAAAAAAASESHRSSLGSHSSTLVRAQSASTGADAGTSSASAAQADTEPEQQRGARARKGKRKKGDDASDDADNADEAVDAAAKQKRARGGSTSSTAPADSVLAGEILRYQGSLAHALSSMAQAERREERERLRRDSRRLGNFRRGLYGRAQDRIAAVQWEGGTEEEEIECLRKRIADQRQQVEELQKAFKKPVKARLRLGQSLEELEEETWEQRELCAAKTAAALRSDTDLTDKVRRLAIERSEHLRLFRRIEEEDKLSFGSFQPLRKRYQLLRLLSRSSSTEVYRAHDLHALCPCTVKIHLLSSNSKVAERQEQLGAISNECEAYKQLALKCPALAMLLDHFAVEDDAKYVTIWEFCEGDSYEAYVCRHAPVPEKETRGIVLQILSTLRYVESKGYPSKNLDLKPSRLALRGGEVKFTGIGFSHLWNVTGLCRRGSNLEVASDSIPLDSQDVLDGSASSSSAVWTTGTIMFELLFGRPPDIAAAADSPTSSWAEPVQFPESPRISAECREFLSRLLDRDRRVSAQQAYSDSFMAPSKKQRAT